MNTNTSNCGIAGLNAIVVSSDGAFQKYLLALFVTIVVVLFSYTLYRSRKATEQVKLDLATKCVKVLRSENASILVLHLRDMLLNPAQRTSGYYLEVWK